MNRTGSPKQQGAARSSRAETPSRAESDTFERADVASELERLSAEVRRLGETVAAKDQLVTELAHELRSPLNAILGWTEILLDRSALDPVVAQGLRVIQRNAVQQARLVDDLVEGARIAHRKIELRLAPTSLDDLLQCAVENACRDAQAKGVAISVDDCADVQFLVVDAPRLQQAIANLLSNAIKFSPRGSAVGISVRSTDHTVELAVQDAGPGVDPAVVPRLFERFAQGRTRGASAGLGVGLAIAKGIVELHGGELRFEDAAGGARFVISLPKTTATPPR